MDGEDIWLPTFNGNGAEDPEQHWFICEVIWMVRLVENADLKKAQIITTLRDRALDWFMKFCVVPPGAPQRNLEQIRATMISKFRKPKSESQCITKIKEIKQALVESIWEFHQRFKTLMAKVCFQMSDVQYKEWLIVALLPHI